MFEACEVLSSLWSGTVSRYDASVPGCLGWYHNHLMVEVAGIWCLLITCKNPGSGSFIWLHTVVIQFQRFQGPLCPIVPSEVIFLLQVIQLGDNSEKLLGFGALHFHLLAKKVTKQE